MVNEIDTRFLWARRLATATLLATLSCAGGDSTNPIDVVFSGTISGTARVDGAPLAGATVTLSGAASRSTQTSGSGTFVFPGIPEGAYVVQLVDYPQDVEFGSPAQTVTLSESQPTASVAFQGAARHEASIEVEVTVEGAAREGISVALTGAESRNATTDATGSVRFDGLPPGSYTATITGFDAEELAFDPTSRPVEAVNDQVAQVAFHGEVILRAPEPLSAFTATANGPTTVELTWTDPATEASVQDGDEGESEVSAAPGDPADYRIERRVGAGGSWTHLVTVPAGTQGYTDTGLDPATAYSYRGQACNDAGCSEFSEESITTTDPVPPTSPTGLGGTAVGPNLVALSWTDTSDDETSFRLERRVDPDGAWSLLVILPSGAITHADGTASSNTSYGYRVQACSDIGCSGYSNEAVVNTPGVPPAAPVGLAATPNGESAIELGWADISADESEFRLERRPGTAGAWAPLVTLPADTEAHSDDGLPAGTQFSYRAQSCNAFGCSAFSNQATATTELSPPIAPTGLTATETGSSSIALGWADNSSDESEFRIERHIGPDAPWSLLTVQPAGTTLFNDSGLDPETEHFYRVTACNVGGCSSASNEASATTEAPRGGLNLDVPVAYLVQRTQRKAGDVPLVKDLDAWVRVFPEANAPNAVQPEVRVRFYLNGTLSHTETISATSGSVPESVDESNTVTSWNAPVSGSLIQPGLSILVDVDPTNAIAEGSESDNFYPATGAPQALTVLDTPPFDVTFIPVRQSVNNQVGNVTAGNMSQYMTAVRQMFPIAEDDMELHAEFVTNQPVLQSNNGNSAWGSILSEVNALRTAEGSSRNYYGVVSTTYSSGVAGIGYVGWPTALGWDKLPSGSGVAAHEWGHNAGRPHSPGCGAGSPDPGYPHANGRIGTWGVNLGGGSISLRSPSTYFDLMTYCNPDWISDYVYESIMQARQAGAAVAAPGLGGSGTAEPSLLLWGRIESGDIVLEPAFVVEAPTRLPLGGGSYRAEGVDSEGSPVFGFSFEPIPVADAEVEEGHFAFTLPLSSFDVERLTEIRVEGRALAPAVRRAEGSGGGTGSGAAAAAAVGQSAALAPTPSGRVAITWNPATHSMAIVRDARTGEILAFARDGVAEFIPASDAVELIFSDGVRSTEPVLRTWR